jgi:actin-related protein 8
MTKTIIIHPGSRWLRIGRASDAFPITIPYAIARRSKTWVPGTTSADKGKQRERYAPPTASAPAPVASVPTQPSRNDDMDVDDDASDDEPTVDPSVPMDPLSAKISSIRGDLRARMRSFKLRGQGNGNSQAIAYNQTVQPERTADYNDPNEIEWTDVSGPDRKEFYVGSEALKIPNAAASGYVLRHPYDRGNFNTADYTSKMELLGDIEQIWMSTLEFELEIEKSELKVCIPSR